MSTADALSSILFGKTRRALLAHLLSRPDEAFYLRELVRAAETGPGAVQRELGALATAGIVRRSARGHQVYYQADASCPVYPELRSLLLKTAGLADVLGAALEPLRTKLRWAFVYGSFARGEHGRGSDVDMCVVGDVAFSAVVEALRSAEDALGREVNPTVYDEREFQRKLAEGHHFVSTVVRGPKIMLLGDADELAGMAGERLAGNPPVKPRTNRRPPGSGRPRSVRRARRPERRAQ